MQSTSTLVIGQGAVTTGVVVGIIFGALIVIAELSHISIGNFSGAPIPIGDMGMITLNKTHGNIGLAILTVIVEAVAIGLLTGFTAATLAGAITSTP
jgi:hypothetical protein